MSEDEQAIREVVKSWMKATKSGDLSTILDLMTDDVLFLTPGREPFGKEEFRAVSQSMKSAEIRGEASVEEVQVTGDWAWLRNRLEITVTPPGGDAIQRSGYALTIFRRGEDGRWRLHRDANLVS